ncbi:hypothetical protein SprV_0100082300 [Sparganum proliferum]
MHNLSNNKPVEPSISAIQWGGILHTMTENLGCLRTCENELKERLCVINRQIDTLSQERETIRQQLEQVKHRIALSKLDHATNSENTSHYSCENSFPWSAEVNRVRQEVFKIQAFRSLQLLAINAYLDGRDVILVMPTGAGKSLVYQCPSLLTTPEYRVQFTLVVSPLVSLMMDQALNLQRLGIPPSAIAVLDSSTPAPAQQKILLDICGDGAEKKKHSEIRIVFVTPEKLSKSKRLMNRLEKAHSRGRLARIAIDEVHCVSQWGNDFRPDYKFLHVLKTQFPSVPILGLTATASAEVVLDVQKMLGLSQDNCLVLRTGYNRPNLNYKVIFRPGAPTATYPTIIKLLKTEFDGQSGLIYCLSQKDTEDLSAALQQQGIFAAFYHANIDAAHRSLVHSKWIDNHILVIVATVAFGMGIDKPDVRFVFHLSASKSLENYYQESGRAGRDERPGSVILFWRLGDFFRLASMVVAERTGMDKLLAMLGYSLEASQCRRQLLAAGLGDRTWSASDCRAACDICRTASARKASVVNAVDLLGCVDAILANQQQRITGAKLVNLLAREKLVGALLDKVGAVVSRSTCLRFSEYFVAWCLLQSYLRMDYHFTPYSTVIYLSATQRTAQPQNLPVPPWVLGAQPEEDSDASSTSFSHSSSPVIILDKRAKKRLAESPVDEVTSD